MNPVFLALTLQAILLVLGADTELSGTQTDVYKNRISDERAGTELLEPRSGILPKGRFSENSVRFVSSHTASRRQHPATTVRPKPDYLWKVSTPRYNCTRLNTRYGLTVNCSHRGISDISTLRLDRPERIKQLDLTGNLIHNIPNGTWSPFVQLTRLGLGGNLLSQLENDTFTGLGRLEVLHLDGNGLVMTRRNFPEDAFKPLLSLKSLYIYNNSVINTNNVFSSAKDDDDQAYPDWALASLTSLEKLYIDGLPNRNFGMGFKNMTALRYLSMNGYNGPCNLGQLDMGLFENVRYLESLTMKRCGITIGKMHQLVLKPLKHLSQLDVSRNVDINLDGLATLLTGQVNSSRLKHLNVNMVVNPYSVSRCVSFQIASSLPRSLEYLDAALNNLEIVGSRVFQSLPKNLSYLNLNGNRFFFGSYLKDMWKMENLKTLKLNGWIRGYDLPRYFQKDQKRVFSCDYDTDEDDAQEEIVFRLPPKLEHLEMNLADLSLSITNFSIDANNSLKYISAYGNNIPSLVGTIHGLHKLKYLDLSRNNIKSISPDFFYHSNLTFLNLSGNACGSYLYQERQSLRFSDTLRFLDLSNVAVKIFKMDFSTLKNLHTLILNNCNLEYFNANLAQANSLKHLDLSENALYTLDPHVLEAIMSIPNLTLNFSGNRVGCFCDNLHFIDWLVHYPHLMDKNLSQLWCDKDGLITEVKDFRTQFLLLQRECASNLLLLSICTSICVSVLLLNFVFIGYRYRWKLRFWYYSAYFSVWSNDPQGDNCREFGYDVNITYSAEDEDFAEETLADALTAHGLRVRISGRDARVGTCMFRDIVEAVQACRRTLVVLSPGMVSSKWCQATVNLAAQEAFNSGRSVLKFLVWQSVDPARLGTSLLFLIQSSDISFFPPEESWQDGRAMELFWRKLSRGLK
ncbi:hypothetical protein EGW08_010209 [Elysia chlorotica]|uniref:TIR domain-containing protein n=1 Tax=Elysia chlorotica TaxID=188477 RepID=A0A433TKD7_ELYCH|nr:hypothetical protein EGW08_010209 [Elysia chlorotica]